MNGSTRSGKPFKFDKDRMNGLIYDDPPQSIRKFKKWVYGFFMF